MQFLFTTTATIQFKNIIIILVLLLLTYPVNANTKAFITKYYDKTIPDEETLLTDFDFQVIRKRRETSALLVTFREQVNEEKIDDSGMYNRKRFEGDIANPGLTSKTVSNLVDDESDAFVNNMPIIHRGAKMPGLMRNAIRNKAFHWPEGKIPYTISKQYTSIGRQKIADAIREYTNKTCIQFTPKTAVDIDYVHILPDDGCYSLVGKVGGKQPVSLGDGCIQKGIIIHELMHAVGFFHEQSRSDRDEYVKIKWQNVEKGLEDQFDKYSLKIIDQLNASYDYGSVMHYGSMAFSTNGLPTIEPIQKGMRIGQRIGFSPTDIFKINTLYDCPNKDVTLTNAAIASGVNNVPSFMKIPIGISATVNVPPQLPSGASDMCIDTREDCDLLASRGYCDSFFSSSYMLANCAKSCEKCTILMQLKAGTTNLCTDRQTWCPGWAASNLCDNLFFKQYMLEKCSLSCGICK